MPDTADPPTPTPPTSLSSLQTHIDRAATSARLASQAAQRLSLDAEVLSSILSNEGNVPQGDRIHVAKWRLLCARLSIDPTVTHHTAIAHLRKPIP